MRMEQIKKTEVVDYNTNTVNAGRNDNTERVISILFNNLYSDTKAATIRELGANALDAHVMCGKGEEPWFIKLPTLEDPILVIEDYGPGLAQDAFDENIMSCGNTNKDNTNKAIGGMGYGSLTCLINGGQAIITNTHKGYQVCYRFFTEDNERKVDILFEQKVDDNQSSIKYEIPLKIENYRDEQEWETACQKVLHTFKVKPNGYDFRIIGDINIDIGNVKLTNIFYRSGIFVTCGGVNYPLEINKLNLSKKLIEKFKTCVSYNDFAMYVDVPIGSVKPTPSRESLFYNDFTKKTLELSLSKAYKDITEYVNKSINSCETYHDAILNYHIPSGELYKLKDFINFNNFYKGKPYLRNFVFDPYGENKKFNFKNKYLVIDVDEKHKYRSKKIKTAKEKDCYTEVLNYNKENYQELISFLTYYEIKDEHILTLDDIEIKIKENKKVDYKEKLFKLKRPFSNLRIKHQREDFHLKNDYDKTYNEGKDILIELNRGKIRCNETINKIYYLELISMVGFEVPELYFINKTDFPKNNKNILTLDNFIQNWEKDNPDEILLTEKKIYFSWKYGDFNRKLEEEVIKFLNLPKDYNSYISEDSIDDYFVSMGKIKIERYTVSINKYMDELCEKYPYMIYVEDIIEFSKLYVETRNKENTND